MVNANLRIAVLLVGVLVLPTSSSLPSSLPVSSSKSNSKSSPTSQFAYSYCGSLPDQPPESKSDYDYGYGYGYGYAYDNDNDNDYDTVHNNVNGIDSVGSSGNFSLYISVENIERLPVPACSRSNQICSEGTDVLGVTYSYGYKIKYSNVSSDDDNGNGGNEGNSSSQSCCDNFYYQRCLTQQDCGPGYCCSLPPASTVQLGGGARTGAGIGGNRAFACGPPACLECTCTNANTTATTTATTAQPSISVCQSIDNDNEQCSSLLYGTCIPTASDDNANADVANGTVHHLDARPGYSCDNEPCQHLQSWAESTCGYHRPTNTFGSTRKRCSEACLDVVTNAGDCLNLQDMIAAYRSLDCTRCQDFFWRRCDRTADCPVGYCCSLPPDTFIPGFFDQDTCGPPQSCQCSATSFDSQSFSETITCSDDCGPQHLGTCQQIGVRDAYSPVYNCDCADPNTFQRTGSPTQVVTFAPTITPSEKPPAVPSATTAPSQPPTGPTFTISPSDTKFPTTITSISQSQTLSSRAAVKYTWLLAFFLYCF